MRELLMTNTKRSYAINDRISYIKISTNIKFLWPCT